jgi:transposase
VNHNHELKSIFKSAATQASTSGGPLSAFYQELVNKGMKPALARVTLARKIAAIALTIWKKGESFNPEQLKRQAASA